ncbi:hypothetical protein ACIRVF_35025 [Kitasatospora sp. NPDC101157]|uniref:hypothetical protein n=1 Tax=Kitasatospora sp. NPDC101157 TaxID=3364098 RepID=UPI003822F299
MQVGDEHRRQRLAAAARAQLGGLAPAQRAERPGRWPVAMPASLSVVVACVS